MKKKVTWPALVILSFGLFVLSPLRPASAHGHFSSPRQDAPLTGTPTASAPSPAEVIAAVNDLRLSRGLNALAVHPVLMQVAAEQASALAASGGMVGHERPCGMTLGQDLLARGYPLLGDLSLDGYRSENWGFASDAQEAISMWLSDDVHTNTMLSPNRSDIGAAVAAYVVVLETALSTSSGKMQYDAYPILTGIPMTQAACVGMITQAAQYGLSPQEMLPVTRNTALPGGEVFHEVQYGQTLWTLAIQYDTTIAEIKRLNNLSSEVIAPGQKLLIKTSATQPAPASLTPPPSPVATQASPAALASPVTPTSTQVAASQPVETLPARSVPKNSLLIVVVVISLSLLLAGMGAMGRKRE
ncbi:MAG: LysM peptidoglycan-binding domain-containing protein [Chloroflexota bacterium]